LSSAVVVKTDQHPFLCGWALRQVSLSRMPSLFTIVPGYSSLSPSLALNGDFTRTFWC